MRLLLSGLPFAVVVLLWELFLDTANPIVVFFARPSDVANYLLETWPDFLAACAWCVLTAITALVLAAICAIALLVLGMLGNGWLTVIERLAASSQAVPLLVIVTIWLLLGGEIFRALGVAPGTAGYSLAPVTISLIFPPLVYGARAILGAPIHIKSLARLWQAPVHWRIIRIYLPLALPDLLTGLRTSSTWAVGATLITEGLLNGVGGESRTLGSFLLRAFSSGPKGRTTAAILAATLLGYFVYHIFGALQRRLQPLIHGTAVEAEYEYPL